MKQIILFILYSFLVYIAPLQAQEMKVSQTGNNDCKICSKKCIRAYEHQAGLCMPYIGNTLDKFPKACQTINNTFNACQSKCPCASG